jgi:hypothetical protein
MRTLLIAGLAWALFGLWLGVVLAGAAHAVQVMP